MRSRRMSGLVWSRFFYSSANFILRLWLDAVGIIDLGLLRCPKGSILDLGMFPCAGSVYPPQWLRNSQLLQEHIEEGRLTFQNAFFRSFE
jgi:hypothetical protein